MVDFNDRYYLLNRYDFIAQYRDVYYELMRIFRCYIAIKLGENESLDNFFSLRQIQFMLNQNGFFYSDDDVYKIIHFLISSDCKVVRKDFLASEPQYGMLDPYLWNSSVQQKYLSLVDDCPNGNKVIAFISDTHIGNDKVFNSKLLHNFYDYAIVCGSKRCFHLGDLFNKLGEQEQEREMVRLMSIFEQEYPKPSLEEMITYGIMGNHDNSRFRFSQNYNSINRLMQIYGYDLQWLTSCNPSFFMLPSREGGLSDGFMTNIGGNSFYFNHRVFSGINTNHIISSVNDFQNQLDSWGNLRTISSDYDVSVFGHIHTGMICSANGGDGGHDKLFLGVPSTSNINALGVVGYLIYIYPEENSMEIAVLGSDNDFKIHEVDRISWSFGKKNKVYCKEYKRAA